MPAFFQKNSRKLLDIITYIDMLGSWKYCIIIISIVLPLPKMLHQNMWQYEARYFLEYTCIERIYTCGTVQSFRSPIINYHNSVKFCISEPCLFYGPCGMYAKYILDPFAHVHSFVLTIRIDFALDLPKERKLR